MKAIKKKLTEYQHRKLKRRVKELEVTNSGLEVRLSNLKSVLANARQEAFDEYSAHHGFLKDAHERISIEIGRALAKEVMKPLIADLKREGMDDELANIISERISHVAGPQFQRFVWKHLSEWTYGEVVRFDIDSMVDQNAYVIRGVVDKIEYCQMVQRL